jgi:thymidylate synthase
MKNRIKLKELIADMRENIMSTRLKVASWNPSEINKTASSMSRQFPSHRVPLFDNENDRSSWKERSKYFSK